MATTTTPPIRLGSSEYRTIHGANGIIRDALESIDEWRTTAEGLRLLDAGTQEQGTTTDAPTELAAMLVDAVTSGQPVPDDLADRAHRMLTTSSVGDAVAHAFNDARAQLTQQLDAALRNNWAVILRALNNELQDVLDQARGLGNLTGLGSAETAIDSDRADEFKTWRSLVDRNAAVRREQMILLRRSGISYDLQFTEIPYLRKPDALFEHWRAWHTHGHLVDTTTGMTQPLTPPWPAGDQRGLLTTGVAGSEEFLRWAVKHDVELWIPTPAEMKTEGERLNKIVHTDSARAQSVEHHGGDEPTFVDPSTVPVPKRMHVR